MTISWTRQYIADSWIAVNDADIDEVERSLGRAIPRKYREFLRSHNGGLVLDAVEFVAPEPFTDVPGPSGVDFLYSVNCGELKWRDLSVRFAAHRGRIPSESIPIGDAGEDLVLLDLVTGEVAYWYRDDEVELIDPEENRHVIASSFSDYIAGFRIVPLPKRRASCKTNEEPYLSIYACDVQGFRDWVRRHSDWYSDSGNKMACFGAACDAHCLEIAEDILADRPRVESGRLLSSAASHYALDIMLLLLARNLDGERPRGELDKESRYFFQVVLENWKAGRFGH